MLYLGLEGRQDHVAHHTIYLSQRLSPQTLPKSKPGVRRQQPSFLRAERLCDRSGSGASRAFHAWYVLVACRQS